jgi:protein subunit release factor A
MKELLFSVTKKDMNLTYFSGKGAGGQNRNRHMNCVRINHKDSGTMVTGQSHKEVRSNIKEALNNLVNAVKFKVWHAKRTAEVLSKEDFNEQVDKMMASHNLKIEGLENDKWTIL